MIEFRTLDYEVVSMAVSSNACKPRHNPNRNTTFSHTFTVLHDVMMYY